MKKSTITKFLEDLLGSISYCLFSKKTISKLNFLKFDVRTILPFIFMAIMTMGYTVNAQNIQGVAPVQAPTGGFGVDGNAWAHEPTGTIYEAAGDWFDQLFQSDPGTHPVNNGLFNDDGSLLYLPLIQPDPPTPPVIQPVPVTYFLKDPYSKKDPTIFTKSNKINDNPNTYTWGLGASPNKNEIQNAAAHFSYGAQGADGGISSPDSKSYSYPITGDENDLWCLFAADRQVTNGSSYVDFEFLQAPLNITGDIQYGPVDLLTNIKPIIGGSGGFSSGFTPGALDATGGRTIGDILVTIEFTQGGGAANVVIRSWTAISPGVYEYVVVSNDDPDIIGNIFCTNNNVQTNVPFDVYGSGSSGIYQPNQWAEGAVNITQVFKYYENPCFVLSTLFIRTRSSGSSDQSELKDFPGAPIQLNLNFIPDAPVTTSATVCGPSGVANLSASGCPGGTLKWYTTETGDVKVHEGLTYSPTISSTTSYWVSCTNAKGCEGPRAEVTGTVNTITPGTISGDQTLCSPFNPSAFTSTTLGSGGGVITYQWQSSTTSAVAGFSNIGGATSVTYDAPAVAVTTWFRRTAISTLNTVPCSDYSNVLVVTPNAVAPGVIAGNQTLCTPADPAAFTSTTAGSGDGVITYQWQISTTSCDTGFSNIGGATSATYDALTVTGATYFRRVVTSTLNGVPCTANSNCLTITPEEIHPGEISGSQTLCSPFNPSAFTSTTLGSGGGVITYQWQSSTTSAVAGFSNIGGATSATYDSPAVAVTTWFRRTATSTLNTVPCSDYSNVLVVTPNAIVPGTISGDQTLCSPFNPSAFTSTTLGSGGGVITYQWQSSTTSAVAGFSNIGGATSATYDAPAVAVTTWFRRTAISTLNTVPCSDYSNVLVVTPNNVSSGSISGEQKVCIGDDPAAFISTTAGTGSGVITYQWQSNTTGCGSAFTDIVGATSATYDPGVASVTTYYLRVTKSTVNDVICSANSNCLTVTAEVCVTALCTYTQGYYGNLGGKSCAPDLEGDFGPYNTLELIERALSSYTDGMMTIGSLGNTVVINNTSADRMAIIDVLPGGGGSYVLSNESSISSLPYLSKNGRVNNTLLAQTITLGLNIGINASLSDFVLQSGMLVTADPEDGCGSETAKTRICNYTDGILTSVTNDYHYYSIDASVINAIDGDKTVQGLFELANKALGGGDTNGVSLSNIASVVDKINNAFDGCKIFMGYDVARCPIDEPGYTSISTTSKTVDTEVAGFTASPVPFEDQLTVKYDFDYQSDVKIEVFNAQGNKVLSKADTNSYLNKEVILNLNVDRGQEQVYIVKLTTNRGSSTRKVMSAR
jgi:hypothetical protein